jgi:3-hydroxyacyl-CoA dehydrogenase
MTIQIRRAAVLGSGTMGSGIAALLASAGIQTLLLDIVPANLTADESKDPAVRNRVAKAGFDRAAFSQPPLFMHTEDTARITIGNLEDDIDKLSGCDWIVEAVVENLGIKQALFKRIETVRRKDAIVSSNTSGIPLKKMSESLSTAFRQHFLGTHFFNPVRYMKLLEIIPGEDTRPEFLSFMEDFTARILGKGVVVAKDTPNFIGNRIGVHGMTRVMQLMEQEEMTVSEVDAIFGPEMGRPKTAMFKTVDLVGLDILYHVASNTYELVVDDEDRESFVLPVFMKQMIEKNLLGKKAESGFYKTELTPEFQKIRKVIDTETFEYAPYDPPAFPCLEAAKRATSLPDKMCAIVYGDDKGAQFAWKFMAGSLIYAANRIPEIADTIIDIDNAMKWGFNFEMGPFETWDAIGLDASVKKMEAGGLPVPLKIKKMLKAGYTRFYKTENGRRFFYDFLENTYKEQPEKAGVISLNTVRARDRVVKTCPSVSLLDLGDGVFCCEFHTKMNALNREIVDFLHEGIDLVEQNGIGLVIGNQAGGLPGAFSAGGDLKYMASLAKEGNFSEMDAFLKTAQAAAQKACYAPFPVVAAPYGMTLGGGCEICLAADKIVAHSELYMGLVEIGVGLLPTGGGCLNLWKKFIAAVPAPVKDYDLSKFFRPVFMSIALADVTSSAADARAKGFLNSTDRIVYNREMLIGEAKKEVVRIVEAGYAPPVKKPVPVPGQAAQGMVDAEIYNMLKGKFISEYDAYLARRIAFVISGGNVRDNSRVDESVILNLERETFIDFFKEEKTRARVTYMLKTGKPLRN